MSTSRRSRRDPRFFVLRQPGREPEIARVSSRGSSSYFDHASDAWVNDPLLGAEIRLSDDWTPLEPQDLPDGVPLGEPAPAPRRRLSRRRLLRRLL